MLVSCIQNMTKGNIILYSALFVLTYLHFFLISMSASDWITYFKSMWVSQSVEASKNTTGGFSLAFSGAVISAIGIANLYK